MGEIAEMMLEGVLCQGCGEYMGDGDGYPVTCRSCANYVAEPVNPNKTSCPICHKRVKVAGLDDHMRGVHAKRLAKAGGAAGKSAGSLP